MVANNCASLSISIIGPVTAGGIFRSQHGGAVALCPGEHVVLVGCISSSIEHRTLLVECGLFVDVVFVAMELGNVCGHLTALSVGPWACANAVLGIISTRALRGEIGMPGLAAGPSGGRESLAMP